MKWSTLKINEQGLLPVVVQDELSNRVVMLAYMNESAFNETISTGEMVYYSRSRQERWKKGESSGNTQSVVSMTFDCDKDTILAVVNQKGVGCHTGAFSCFDTKETDGVSEEVIRVANNEIETENVLLRLEAIIEARKTAPVEGSYTNYLFDKGIDKMLKKVGEEAAEVIIAAKNNDRKEVIYEVSDLMYHLMVTLNDQGVKWSDVAGALSERFPEE